jgi:hypothetical protein
LLGALLTVEFSGEICDIAVRELAIFKGGWRALCGLIDPF